MFVKVDDEYFVNLINVSEVRVMNDKMRVFFNDGEEYCEVKDKKNFFNKMDTFNQAIKRLATGGFN